MDTYEFIQQWPGEEVGVKISIRSTLLFMIMLIIFFFVHGDSISMRT